MPVMVYRACCPGSAMLAVAGYQLRENFTDVDAYVGPVSNAVIITLVLGYLWRVWRFKPPADRSES